VVKQAAASADVHTYIHDTDPSRKCQSWLRLWKLW